MPCSTSSAPEDASPRLYAVVDHRTDGRPRIVGEFVDPRDACAAAELLRAAGAEVDVALITSIYEAVDRTAAP